MKKIVNTLAMVLIFTLSIFSQETWTPTGTSNSPAARQEHSAVWTGNKMIIWGGFISGGEKTGGIYDPATGTWTTTSITNAPYIRSNHLAVWTGSKMIVWGGYNNPEGYFNTGGIYDPVTDTWTATSTTNAPAGRAGFIILWTGTKMIIWGGYNNSYLNTGGIYDPATDSWTAISTTNAPQGRSILSAIWTGSKMIVWGGFRNPNDLNTGGIYDPSTDTWTAISTTNAPEARRGHSAVWTGSKMIVWGGISSSSLNTGGIYDPLTDTWTTTSTANAPLGRNGHSAVWTGYRMIIWSGQLTPYPNYSYTNTGGIYNPLTDTWTATTLTDVPVKRHRHTTVWTGNKMIVWGGYSGSNYLNTGGIYYNPEAITEIPGNESESSNGFSVSQNYPNPFKGSSVVVVNIEKPIVLELVVKNIIGQTVFMVPAKNYSTGIQKIKIEASGLASGVYFYTVNSADYSVTRKMIVE